MPDEALEPIPLFELRAQVRVLRFQPPLLERRVERVKKLVDLKRLADEVPRTAFDGLDSVFDGAEAGDHDGHDVRIALDGGVNHGRAVDTRQAEVRDDDVEGEVGELREGGFAGGGLFDQESPRRELFGDDFPQGGLVFYEEQMLR